MPANYRSLIVAGCGTVGSALLKVGGETLRSFERIIVVDKSAEVLAQGCSPGVVPVEGDVTDLALLPALAGRFPSPAVFVNLCPGLDNTALRRQCGELDMAYLDSASATMPADGGEYRYSVLMPYTYTPVPTRRPQFICFGINPGLVELVARRLLREPAEGPRDVLVAEYDSIHVPGMEDGVVVGWSPTTLVEEVMLSPTLCVVDGKPREATSAGAEKVRMSWAGKTLRARLVPHEDIWNMHLVPGVRWAGYAYALKDVIMAMLDGPVDAALAGLRLPDGEGELAGTDTVLVKVSGPSRDSERSLVWQVDHAALWRSLGVNGVAYQTSRGVLLGVELLQHSGYGGLPGLFSATTLPIADGDWAIVDGAMERLDIRWADACHLGVSLVDGLWTGAGVS